jgi:hypothetical protein
MTDRTELARQIADCDSAISCAETKVKQQQRRRAELQAQLAAMDAEPDWEAWRPALNTFLQATGWKAGPSWVDEKRIRGLIAALPLAPRAAMDDAAVEALARSVVANYYPDLPVGKLPGYDVSVAQSAIRATLSRVPAAAWPGEVERASIAWQAYLESDSAHPSTVAENAMNALIAHMTGGAQ